MEDTTNALEGVPDKSEEKEELALAKKTTSGKKTGDVILSVLKKSLTVGCIYLLGYWKLSIAWLLGPIALLVIRDQWRKDHLIKQQIAKESALHDEKNVILARVDDLPAWVYFPDIERAEWLNRIMKQVWPNVNHFTRDLVKKVIEPAIAKSLASYKLSGFTFERIILGSIPPRIGGVKVYDRNISRNEIIMDVDLFYISDCDITFYLKGVKGGIKDFQLHGMVRVVMKPLIKTMPIVGGLQVFFLNNPTVDFNLVGIADILDMPGLSDILRRVIVEQVAAMMVLPNKFPIKLADVVESEHLKIPEPEGVIRIHVIEAKNLMKMDVGMLGKGKSDPYAVLRVGAQEFRTKTINNTVNPKWDYWCEFTVLESRGQLLNIQLWDSDDLQKDDESLGRATVEISNVVREGQVDTWLTLEQAKHGMVHLRMTWMSLSSDYNDLKEALFETQQLRVTDMNTALLTVFVDSAKNLPQVRAASKPDPYVELSVGKLVEKTIVQMRTDCPVWEQGFTFMVANPDTDTLHFKVLDQKTEQDLGTLTVNLTAISSKPGMQINKQPFGLIRGGGDSKLVLSMNLKIFKLDSRFSVSAEGSEDAQLSRHGSTKSNRSFRESIKQPISREASLKKTEEEPEVVEEAVEETAAMLSSTPPSTTGSIRHRSPSFTNSAGDFNLGKIQLTLRYSVQRQKFIVIIHKIANLPLKDPSDVPDPYVKLYLLPERGKDSKRKTRVIKDNCNPTYDETLEYLISQGELYNKQLEVTVVTQKKLFYSSTNIMGQVIIDLSQLDLNQAVTSWFDLQPEAVRE